MKPVGLKLKGWYLSASVLWGYGFQNSLVVYLKIIDKKIGSEGLGFFSPHFFLKKLQWCFISLYEIFLPVFDSQ